jgi:hypothetical protein
MYSAQHRQKSTMFQLFFISVYSSKKKPFSEAFMFPIEKSEMK